MVLHTDIFSIYLHKLFFKIRILQSMYVNVSSKHVETDKRPSNDSSVECSYGFGTIDVWLGDYVMDSDSNTELIKNDISEYVS